MNEPTLALKAWEMGPICPYISVEISFRPDLHANSAKSMSKKGNQKLLTALFVIALNGSRKSPKIPQS